VTIALLTPAGAPALLTPAGAPALLTSGGTPATAREIVADAMLIAGRLGLLPDGPPSPALVDRHHRTVPDPTLVALATAVVVLADRAAPVQPASKEA
jgi:hypothetical protein